MPLNKSKGMMYEWCTHTLTCLEGACQHNCCYCYVKSLMRYPVLAAKYSGEPRLVESDVQLDLGKNRTIFVCSANDLFADNVPSGLIQRVIDHCNKYPSNTYLWQSKNPGRFKEFSFPEKTILGITLETNRDFKISHAPTPFQRFAGFCALGDRYRKMVSIEPVMDFDLEELVKWIWGIDPEFVSVGADSKRHGLPEPSTEKLLSLISQLREFTQVKIKDNLARLGVSSNG